MREDLVGDTLAFPMYTNDRLRIDSVLKCTFRSPFFERKKKTCEQGQKVHIDHERVNPFVNVLEQ